MIPPCSASGADSLEPPRFAHNPHICSFDCASKLGGTGTGTFSCWGAHQADDRLLAPERRYFRFRGTVGSFRDLAGLRFLFARSIHRRVVALAQCCTRSAGLVNGSALAGCSRPVSREYTAQPQSPRLRPAATNRFRLAAFGLTVGRVTRPGGDKATSSALTNALQSGISVKLQKFCKRKWVMLDLSTIR
jgi:hypothetical protein